MTVYTSLTLALKKFQADVRSEALRLGKLTVQEQADKLNDVVKTWSNKIVFRVKTVARTGETKYQLIAEGTAQALNVFKWVDAGTKKHIIRPKSPNKALVFFTPYSARTAPIANPNAGTGKSGNTKNVRRYVNHPGTKAREFIAFTKLEAEDDFERRLNAYIAQLARR